MSNKENSQKGVQFQFRKRYRHVDWKSLASVDVDRVARDLDYHALQANIMNVAFCDPRGQDFQGVEEEFVKLYTLAQFTIEYLLNCQEYLSHEIVKLESKCGETVKLKEKLETKQKELSEVKKESRKRKKMIAVYQGMMNSNGANGFHKCQYCDKAFISGPFLTSHMERRHGIPAPANQADSLDKMRIRMEDLEKELLALGQQNTILQTELAESKESKEEALRARDGAVQQQLQLEQAHKDRVGELQEKQAAEIEQIKDIYLKQASEALEEKRIAELALVEAKKGIVSNLGALRDEDHEQDELRQEQLQELEDQFNFKICSLQQELERQASALRTREEEHKSALEDANKRVERLQRQLEDKAETEQRLQEILSNVEVENAKLIQLNKEKADMHSTLSPAVIAQLSPEQSSGKVEVQQKVFPTQPVDLVQYSHEREIPTERLHTPFQDRQFIKTYYNHATEAIEASRRELENEIAIRTLNIAACPDVDSLSNEELAQYREEIARERAANNTTQQVKELNAELDEIVKTQKSRPAAAQATTTTTSPSPIPSSLPPKSPSFKQSRESLTRPNSSKRAKPTPPASDGHLRSPSYPEIPTEGIITSTPKVPPKLKREEEEEEEDEDEEVEESLEDSYEDDEDEDIEEIDLEDERGNERGGEVRVGDLESDQTDDEEDEEGDVDDADDLFGDETTASTKTPGYTLRDPSYDPAEDVDSEPEVTPTYPVKRRAHATPSNEIFTFDGWSKMKNRNSMSADDAQQNIPMGHVAKMRGTVEQIYSKKAGRPLSTGQSYLSGSGPSGGGQQVSPPSTRTDLQLDEDDFTVSSLSERELSPVGMKIDIKRNTRTED